MANRKQISHRARTGARRWLDLHDAATAGNEAALAQIGVIDGAIGSVTAGFVRDVLVDNMTAGEISVRGGGEHAPNSRSCRRASRGIARALEQLADYFNIRGAKQAKPAKPTPVVVDGKVQVDDPERPGRKVEVELATKDDVLAQMLSAGFVNRRQFEAGRRYQQAVAKSEPAPRAAHFWEPSVDCGSHKSSRDGSRAVRALALNELAQVKSVFSGLTGLGINHDHASELLFRVLGPGGQWPAESDKALFLAQLDFLAKLYEGFESNVDGRIDHIPPLGADKKLHPLPKTSPVRIGDTAERRRGW